MIKKYIWKIKDIPEMFIKCRLWSRDFGHTFPTIKLNKIYASFPNYKSLINFYQFQYVQL